MTGYPPEPPGPPGPPGPPPSGPPGPTAGPSRPPEHVSYHTQDADIAEPSEGALAIADRINVKEDSCTD